MRLKQESFWALAWLLVLVLTTPQWVIAQGTEGKEGSKPFKQEELDQMLAPVALYPDDLLTQLLMASTYPLEIVQAERWTKKNKDLKGDALTKALENGDWDPSVKSLVNFPQVLQMMNENLDWTQKLGDAFLAQQKEVMQTIQKLRWKAQESGNLKSTEQQKVIVEEKVIVIQPAQPEVVYVPTYNATVVYGVWAYPAYPPPAVYYPAYVPSPAYSFAAGVAVGAAWGYAWGHSDWHGGDVDVNVARNTNINNNINREKYKNNMQNRGQGEGGRGNWQHDPSHRKGASYRDQGTAERFNRGSSGDKARSRDSFRGRSDQGRQDSGRDGLGDRGGSDRGDRGGFDRGGGAGQPSVSDRGRGGDSAFGGSQRGSEARQQSDRGRSSRESMSSRGGGGGFSGGGGGGGSRGGGGGGRGGGGGGRR